MAGGKENGSADLAMDVHGYIDLNVPRSTITELPDDVRMALDRRILNRKFSTTEHAQWLNELGYPISRSAVGRYMIHVNEAAGRVVDTLVKTQAIVKAVESDPDLDYTKASRILAMDGLLQRVSTADDEFLELPLDKAIRLIDNLTRTEIYDKKFKQELKNKTDLAFDKLESDLMDAINNDLTIAPKLHALLVEAREKLTSDD